MILSFVFLKTKYGKSHIIGTGLCLVGILVLILSDFLAKDGIENSENPVLGDILCFLGTFFYSISNVGQEFWVKTHDRIMWLTFLGIFGSIISGVQL
jgi:solute carrier family 35 protein F1/2